MNLVVAEAARTPATVHRLRPRRSRTRVPALRGAARTTVHETCPVIELASARRRWRPDFSFDPPEGTAA